MNKNMKRTVATMMIAGMTFSGAAGVFAGTNMQKIDAFLNHSIGFKINGSTYIPKDENGNKLAPITYHDTTYLPVRALSNALNTPIQYDGKTNTIYIGTSSTEQWVLTNYTEAQLDDIKKAFAGFDGFETAYAPQIMIKGDALQKAAATADGVNLLFKNMTVNVSPRDYSHDYDGTTVILTNGVKAKWYKQGDTALMTVKLDDRYVTVSSPGGKLSKAQLEKVAVSVTKVGSAQTDLAKVTYTAAQSKAIKEEFAKFDGFTTAYAPTKMAKDDAFQKVASGDSVIFWFKHMNVQISPRDYSYGYDSTNVTLPNGVKAKWFKQSDTAMLTLQIDDRYVTISSADKSLSNIQIEQIATGVVKMK
ncbi:copper amine oxidase N-terminal domain-containing protein [Paenibacillus glycanilyticus]|uniref:stalk domain-containing protein n=1 Tax=Paenibacillus glycanilyticus TaxID=126569 RepID=UPI002041267C|nr:stalk domain-containing protein [Paenibacillus glycanilyticus]MCM3629372.1 copper amine oxidase N-terminal domain-containing protein [Paenibacillus glycanilyticus]